MQIEEYRKALKAGKKVYRRCKAHGQCPFLPSLPKDVRFFYREPLGILEIPLDALAGTCFAGRQSAFAPGFYPLLPEESEFAQKWTALCTAQLETGIFDPIRCYLLNDRFYVIEGHKRVSVLKHCGAVAVPAETDRLYIIQ